MGSTVSSISALESGGSVSAHTLFNALYSELHGLARRELARRGHPATLGRNHAEARRENTRLVRRGLADSGLLLPANRQGIGQTTINKE